MSDPALIPTGSVEVNQPTNTDVENIRPGGETLVIPDTDNSNPIITITLDSRPELGSLKIAPNSDTSNVDTFVISVEDIGDVSPTQIGGVSSFLKNSKS